MLGALVLASLVATAHASCCWCDPDSPESATTTVGSDGKSCFDRIYIFSPSVGSTFEDGIERVLPHTNPCGGAR